MDGAVVVGPVVQKALALIEAHLDDRLTLPAMAALLGINPYHLAHVFKRSTGMAPHQYLIRRRVERAKELLSSTELPIADIALAVGCANQSHFSALFHRVAGVTPHSFRRPAIKANRARFRYTPTDAADTLVGARPRARYKIET